MSKGWHNKGRKSVHNRKQNLSEAIERSLTEEIKEPHHTKDVTDWKAYWAEKNKREKDAAIKALEDYKEKNKEKLSQLEEEIKQNN